MSAGLAATIVSLRSLEAADSTRLLPWRNSPDVARYMYTDHAISPEEHGAWFTGALADLRRQYWIIELGGAPVGLANLYDIEPIHRRCSWAYYLADPSTRGRGVGTYVEYFVLAHVFDRLQLNKLCCEVFLANEAVWKLHESFGFEREGMLSRSHHESWRVRGCRRARHARGNMARKEAGAARAADGKAFHAAAISRLIASATRAAPRPSTSD